MATTLQKLETAKPHKGGFARALQKAKISVLAASLLLATSCATTNDGVKKDNVTGARTTELLSSMKSSGDEEYYAATSQKTPAGKSIYSIPYLHFTDKCDIKEKVVRKSKKSTNFFVCEMRLCSLARKPTNELTDLEKRVGEKCLNLIAREK